MKMERRRRRRRRDEEEAEEEEECPFVRFGEEESREFPHVSASKKRGGMKERVVIV